MYRSSWGVLQLVGDDAHEEVPTILHVGFDPIARISMTKEGCLAYWLYHALSARWRERGADAAPTLRCKRMFIPRRGEASGPTAQLSRNIYSVAEWGGGNSPLHNGVEHIDAVAERSRPQSDAIDFSLASRERQCPNDALDEHRRRQRRSTWRGGLARWIGQVRSRVGPAPAGSARQTLQLFRITTWRRWLSPL